MKKKGFTLIELLAVLVILAIIVLIIVPVISNVIDSSRKAAFKESVNGIIDSTNNYVSDYVIKNKDELKEYPVVFTCNGETCTNGEYTLEFKGTVPKGGNVIIDETGILSSYITDGKYCAYGYKWDMQVGHNCGDVDVTSPSIPTSGTIGDVSGSNRHATIQTPASGSTDDISDVVYKYLVTNDSNMPDKNDARFTVSRDFTRNCGTTYYAWAIAEDLSGNRSEVCALGSTSDAPDSYSDWSQCSKECGGGTRTRTNTCSLVTENLSEACNTHGCSYDATDTTYNASPACSNGRTLSNGNCTYYYSSNSSQCGTESCNCSCNSWYCLDYGKLRCEAGVNNGECFYDANWCNVNACGSQSCSTCAKSCTKTENDYRYYTCNDGDVVSGTTCHHYTCPQGGTLSGTTCVR
nr:thrombospondin type-1 domain-containing protein [Bacilli bacterium]